MLPQIMNDCIKYLEENNFIMKNPTEKSIELRNIAVEYASQLVNRKEKIAAIVLTGSSVGGYSGEGSDIDLDVLVNGKTKPIIKKIYKKIPIDLQYKSYEEWKDDCKNNCEATRYLTHTVPIIDNSGEFQKLQKQLLSEYYSAETMKAHYNNISKIVIERSEAGVYDAENGDLISSAIKIESALYEAISLLIYRYKGFTATSLILSELDKISKLLNHPEWFAKMIEYMRFNISAEIAEEYLKDYGEIYIRMRELISENPNIPKKIRRRNLGYFSAGNLLEELCSETDYIQTCDKIRRALAKNKNYDAGLNFWFGIHFNFFMFSPFFYLKNVNKDASVKEITSKTFQTLYGYWDNDIKKRWAKIYGSNFLTKELLVNMSNLSKEILPYCIC